MNPLRIRARNYRSFDTLDLELPTGCAAVVGENGAGKSSVVNAIDLCLFGPDSRSLGPYLTEGEDADLEIELTFEHAGELYRVRRGFSARGRGKSTLDLETLRTDHDPDERDQWEPLTRENVRATQERVEQILGLTRQTFRASAFLAQGDGAAFTDADPAERKQILAKIIGLDVWESLRELVRRDQRDATGRLDRIAGLVGHADEELARIPDLERSLGVLAGIETAAVKDLASAEKALADAGVRVQALQEQVAARRELEAKAEAASIAFLAHDEKRVAAVEAKAAADRVRAEIAALPADDIASLEREEAGLRDRIAASERALSDYRARVGEAKAAQTRRADFLGAASELNEKAHAIREIADQLAQGVQHEERCDRCQQILGVEARQAAIASYRADADRLDAEAVKLDAQAAAITIPDIGTAPTHDEEAAAVLTAISGKLIAARDAQRTWAQLRERIAALNRIVAVADNQEFLRELERLHDAQQEASVALDAAPAVDQVEIARVQTAGLQARAWVEQERSRLEQARTEKAVAGTDLARLRDLETKIAAARAEHAELHETLDLLAVLDRAYGRDGIPSLIVQNTALPAIELEATRILQELGTSYRVELRAARELKGGGVGDALDVILITEAGERPYETLSGGERTRLNLALRIALARLLAHRRGAESRLLAIDEPEFLDTAGTQALAGVLQGLAATGDFERVYLVSHVPDLAGAFDQVLEVVKDGDRSRIVGSDVREQAAA